jgi:N-acetylneuraminic acid mutarotase
MSRQFRLERVCEMKRHGYMPAVLILLGLVIGLVTVLCFANEDVSGSAPGDGLHRADRVDGRIVGDSWTVYGHFENRDRMGWVVDQTNGDIYVFGGVIAFYSSDPHYLNDLWRYNHSSGIWHRLPDGSVTPSKRVWAKLALDPSGKKLYLSSGNEPGVPVPKDLWVYDISKGQWQKLLDDCGEYLYEIGYSAGFVYGITEMWLMQPCKLYTYEVRTGRSQSYQTINPPSPERRWWGATFDPVNLRFYVFGGCEYYQGRYWFYDDLWVMQINTRAFSKRASHPVGGRYQMDIAYDRILNAIYLYGGAYSNINMNSRSYDDLWIYYYDNDTWSQLLNGCPPAKQYAHWVEFDAVNRIFYLNSYGGYGGNPKLWTYNLTSGNWTIQQQVWPPHLRFQSLVAEDDQLLVFGGWDLDASSPYGEMMRFDTTTLRWETLQTPGGLEARALQGTARDRDGRRLFIYGGSNLTEDFHDLWMYNISSNRWTKLTFNYPFPMVTCPAVAYSSYDSSIYVFGGINVSTGDFVSNLWRFSLTTGYWSLMSTGGPSPRANCTMVYNRCERSLCVFGGMNGSAPYSDLWSYSLETGEWRQLVTSVQRPQDRFFHDAAYNPYTNEMFIFGGYTWSGEPLNDLWIISFENLTWRELSPANAPPARRGHSIDLNLNSSELFVFGGHDLDRSVWKLDLFFDRIAIVPKVNEVEVKEDQTFNQHFRVLGLPPTSWTFETNAEWLDWNATTRNLTGTPHNGDVGEYWVRMNVTNEYGDYDAHEFTMVVKNVPPRILTIDVTNAVEDIEYLVDYNSTDDGQGRVTWSFTSAAESWLSMDSETGVLSGIPSDEHVGSFIIIVSVNDGNDGWDRSTFTLVVANVNDHPNITSMDGLEATEDEAYIVDYEAMDPDPTGDALLWTLNTNASFLELHSVSGVLSGTPTNDDVGTYWVRVRVSDGNGGFDERIFTLKVLNVNDAPTIGEPVLGITMDEDGIDTSIDLYLWFQDIDDDVLDFRCDGWENITATILPNGTVLLEPRADWSGSERLTFYANDSEFGVSDFIDVIVLPVNDAPTDVTITLLDMTYYEGKDQMAFANASDADLLFGDELRYIWSSNVTGNIGYGSEINLSLPEGLHTITLNVTDLDGACCTSTVEIEIHAVPDDGNGNGNGNGDGNGDGKPIDEEDGDEKKVPAFFFGVVALLILVIVVVGVALLLFRKRPPDQERVEEGVPTDPVDLEGGSPPYT